MKTFETYETVTPDKNLHILTPFLKPEDNSLSVFVDGEALSPDEYTSDEKSITFNEDVQAAHDIILSGTISRPNSTIVISPSKTNLPRAIFPKYAKENTLKLNNTYHFDITIDNEIYSSDYTTKRNPMFSTSKKVIEQIGEFIDGFSDDYIDSMIYNNSVAVISLIDELAEEDISNVTYEHNVTTDLYTTDYRTVKNWVLYATCIDLIYARYFGISRNYGSIRKTVGDIDVEKSTKLPYIDNLLSKFRKLFDEADKIIRGFNTAVAFVKAKQYTYEDWERDTKFE